jgi:uncharacterized membrane protein required for colicin V production
MPGWLNPFDVFIIVGMLIGAAIGFVRGLVRMALSVAVLYITTVLGVLVYRPMGKWINNGFGVPLTASLSFSFVLIVILGFIIISAMLRRVYKDTELPGIRRIDQLGGLIVGFFVGCLWIGLAVLVLNFLLTATMAQTGAAASRNMLYYFRQSALIPVFYDFLQIALVTLKPWIPKGVPPELLQIP